MRLLLLRNETRAAVRELRDAAACETLTSAGARQFAKLALECAHKDLALTFIARWLEQEPHSFEARDAHIRCLLQIGDVARASAALGSVLSDLSKLTPEMTSEQLRVLIRRATMCSLPLQKRALEACLPLFPGDDELASLSRQIEFASKFGEPSDGAAPRKRVWLARLPKWRSGKETSVTRTAL